MWFSDERRIWVINCPDYAYLSISMLWFLGFCIGFDLFSDRCSMVLLTITQGCLWLTGYKDLIFIGKDGGIIKTYEQFMNGYKV